VDARPTSALGLFLTWVALLALAALSLLLASAHLGAAALPAALGLAAAKASLVALFFMELRGARFTLRLSLVAAVAFIALLSGLMSADVATREAPPLRPPPVTTSPR
jgi:cytochrome c oxidase subunit 4